MVSGSDAHHLGVKTNGALGVNLVFYGGLWVTEKKQIKHLNPLKGLVWFPVSCLLLFALWEKSVLQKSLINLRNPAYRTNIFIGNRFKISLANYILQNLGYFFYLIKVCVYLLASRLSGPLSDKGEPCHLKPQIIPWRNMSQWLKSVSCWISKRTSTECCLNNRKKASKHASRSLLIQRTGGLMNW